MGSSLDNVFEGMFDDADIILNGWFAVRKIKGQYKPKKKIRKLRMKKFDFTESSSGWTPFKR